MDQYLEELYRDWPPGGIQLALIPRKKCRLKARMKPAPRPARIRGKPKRVRVKHVALIRDLPGQGRRKKKQKGRGR